MNKFDEKLSKALDRAVLGRENAATDRARNRWRKGKAKLEKRIPNSLPNSQQWQAVFGVRHGS
jgi:hypothetical protein